MEFMRQQYIKTLGKKQNAMKRIKLRDERLDHDSISEITDLSQEDVLATSKQLLTEREQKRLDKYNQ